MLQDKMLANNAASNNTAVGRSALVATNGGNNTAIGYLH